MNGTPAIEIRNLEKRFGPVIALRDVTFAAHSGEIVGLIGVNGAGKSTLMNILDGQFPPSRGTVLMGGAPVRFDNPKQAREAGIGFIHQHSTAFDHLSVAENICLQSSGPGWFSQSAVTRTARHAMERLGAGHVDVRRPVGGLPIGDRQLVDVARVLVDDPAILLFDEPTASLSRQEAEHLFTVIRSLRDEGRTIFYTSHFLDDIRALADRVVVLRDGGVVMDEAIEGVTRERMVTAMLSRDLVGESAALRPDIKGPVVLKVSDLKPSGRPEVSFELRRGEILGIWGLLGAGRTELLRALLGHDPAETADIELTLKGKTRSASPRALRRHVGFVTEDRHHDGLFLSRPVWENLTAAALSRFTGTLGRMNVAEEKAAASRMIDRLGIRAGALDNPISTLSGGNQQKVVLARWLLREPEIYIFDEPTHGVDVGAKAQIHAVVHELADRGASVLVVSSEVEEIFGLANRILVLRDGRINAELTRAEFDQAKLLEAS